MPVCLAVVICCAIACGVASADGPAPTGDPSRFEPSRFARPDSWHYPGYFWLWNDQLNAGRLARQLREMATQGARTVCHLPEPAEFRPTSMPTPMAPGYLTPEFMQIFASVADESARLGMRMWLYDEGGWPSGSAAGRVTEGRPDLGLLGLRWASQTVPIDGRAACPPDALAAFLQPPDGAPVRVRPGESVSAPTGGALTVFTVSRNGRYPSLLEPDATARFLALTHDAYANAAGKHLGGTIPFAFTDEPNVGAFPWARDLVERFLARYGYDIRDRLLSLSGGTAPEDCRTRIDYLDWWSERFAASYFRPIQEWCHAHRMLSGGHLNGEDETEGSRRHGSGSVLRCLRALDVPGVDVIWRQLWPGANNHHFPKLASSVANQGGKRWSFTESFCVYGAGLTPAQMKWVLDYQFVRGINLAVFGCYPASTRDFLQAGERPLFGPQFPMWRRLAPFHAYVARLSYLLSIGRPAVRTALYFPIRDTWAQDPQLKDVVRTHDAVARRLAMLHCDYDIIDDDCLSLPETVLPGGTLRVGRMDYDTVVVGRCNWLAPASRERLEQLVAAGGRVVWVDGAKGDCTPTGAVRTMLDDLGRWVHPLLRVTSGDATELRVAARETPTGRIYYLTNEGLGPLRCRVLLEDGGRATQLDCATGRSSPASGEQSVGGWLLPVDLPFAGSLVVRFETRKGPIMAAGPRTRLSRELAAGWTIAPRLSFTLGEHDVAVARPREAARPVRLGDWSSSVGDAFSGECRYRVAFTVTAEDAAALRQLDLGEVRYACEAWVNGRRVGERLWGPWVFDIAGTLHAGENVVEVVVTNTMANQYVKTRTLDRWEAWQLGPYHPRALGFEPDSLASGLYGPVMLR